MGDKRRFMRFDVVMDAICRISGVPRKIKVQDFCKEGIGVLTPEAFDKGRDIEVELSIPGDNVPVLFEGEVAWSGASASDTAYHRGGIKFKKIGNHDRGRILEYIYQRWIMSMDTEAKRKTEGK